MVVSPSWSIRPNPEYLIIANSVIWMFGILAPIVHDTWILPKFSLAHPFSETKPSAAVTSTVESSDKNSDPKKKLRNLKKKLSDIESLQSRLDCGELKHPEPEQLEKLNRRVQVETEIRELEELIKKL